MKVTKTALDNKAR